MSKETLATEIIRDMKNSMMETSEKAMETCIILGKAAPNDEGKECTEFLKSETKKLIDSIGTESELDQRIIKLIHGFARAGFLESRAYKVGAE